MLFLFDLTTSFVSIAHHLVTRSRLHDRFYATRSTSEQRVVVDADSNESLLVSKKSSDSSVICLGTFRKIPELINLEDGDDDYRDEIQSSKFEVTVLFSPHSYVADDIIKYEDFMLKET